MSSIGQLDLFAQQPQVIRYNFSGTTYNRLTGDDSVQPGNESEQFSLHNDRGEVLVSLPGRRNRSVPQQARHRQLLEIAFSQGQTLAGLKLPGLKLAQVHLVGVKRMDLTDAVLPNALVTGGRLWANLRGSMLTKSGGDPGGPAG